MSSAAASGRPGTGNRLLDALPDDVWARVSPHLERVELSLGTTLYEPGAQLPHVYFPTTCIVSLLYVMENGASAEIAVAGLDSIVGISLFMGGESTSSRAVVQSAGQAWRLGAGVLMRSAPCYPRLWYRHQSASHSSPARRRKRRGGASAVSRGCRFTCLRPAEKAPTTKNATARAACLYADAQFQGWQGTGLVPLTSSS